MGEHKIWANSGDSHFIEPEGLWQQILPASLAARMPRAERVSDVEEVLHIDGETFRRPLPKIATKKVAGGLTMNELSSRPAGARDLQLRLADLDQEGIWGEVVYSSLGLWEGMIKDRALVQAAAAAENEWKASEVQGIAPHRLVVAASLPVRDIGDAVAEAKHAADLGLHAVSLPTPGVPNSNTAETWITPLNSEDWEPLWAVIEDLGLVLSFHIGGDAGEHTMYRGPGGAIMNYTNSTYSGQRAAMIMVSSGALDRHPRLRVLVSEGGASWVPFLGERMNEGYRQHSMFVRPILSRPPKEILYEQVYVSFQHETTAVAAMTAMGYNNVMWGSDYPHLEGTYGHTQKTLHELFDDVPEAVRRRITIEAFGDLFPHVPPPPGN